MAKTNSRTSNVINFQAAKAARMARPCQGRLPKPAAAQAPARVRKAVAAGRTGADIARALKRDAVRQAARAAL